MLILFLSLATIYLAATAVLDAQLVKRLTSVPVTERVRLGFYTRATVFGWASVAAIIIMCLIAPINLADIGLRRLSFEYTIWFTVITLVISGLLLLSSLYQISGYLASAKFREAIKDKFAGDKSQEQYDVITDLLVPRTKKEKRVFSLVALTAGIGEELLLRGFLFFLLQTVFPGISVILVVAISGVFFGMWHLYQGVYGMIKTAVIGALFGCLYVATGSLILPMLLHFISDFAAAFVLSDSGIDS
jgi:membrane protease YdiL (CAAX protease family)